MIEAAITLPLTLFLILGTLQLFLMLQARVVSEYAVFRATRAGSVSQGKCERMRHAAIAALLPTITRTRNAAELANAFGIRRNNKYAPARDSRHNRDIVWLERERPTLGEFLRASNSPGVEDSLFDDPDRPLRRLDVRMIYWYPLRMPFVNWVMSHMFLAHFQIRRWTQGDATMLYKRNAADWNEVTSQYRLQNDIAVEMRTRILARQYVFPIQATASLRMMTPARREYFLGDDPWCLWRN